MLSTIELSETDWQTANDMARQLAEAGTDANELKKSLTYLLSVQNREGISQQFRTYLMTLATDEDIAKRSEQTNRYNKSIYDAYLTYLQKYESQPDLMCHVLGWTTRLIRYHKFNRSSSNSKKPNARKHSPPAKNRSFYKDQPKQEASKPTKATVKRIQKNTITYQVGIFELKQEEPALSKKLKKGKTYPAKLIEVPGQKPTVEIIDV